jgi:glucoamylase
MKSLILGGLLAALGTSQSCTLEDAQKTDCGYFGINQQQCESKSCCWRPVYEKEMLGGTPWCFFPSGQSPCETLNWDGSKGPGFDDIFYDKMYKLFDVNINILGKGGVVAAPDRSTPGGSYYYHWMRDAALTMRTYMELNNF